MRFPEQLAGPTVSATEVLPLCVLLPPRALQTPWGRRQPQPTLTVGFASLETDLNHIISIVSVSLGETGSKSVTMIPCAEGALLD